MSDILVIIALILAIASLLPQVARGWMLPLAVILLCVVLLLPLVGNL